ncbi:uncharacterized protein LOC126374613 [Pectinophora gossypiella]|uniref:uncharacterized protein LOC126374613 n=1 Tax=Pectinophora gossypiella TaxID=13191 RepID=UPI00214E326B|nr:uncharacterized protein LOC126374613 [Pectinophora gossypiella]
MTHSHAFTVDALNRAARSNMRWYHNNLVRVLENAKEKHARDIDPQIVQAHQLIGILDEKVDLPVVVPLREVEHSQDDSLMKPIEKEVLDIFYKSTEKGGDTRYLHERVKKRPEDRFFFRIVSSWDYGWQQKQSRVPARDVNYGRCYLLRDTFYRKNNVGPDPPHYAQPSGGEVTICSEYACNPT